MTVHDLDFHASQLRQCVDRFQSLSPDYRLRFAGEYRVGGFDALFVNPGCPVEHAVLLLQFVINGGADGIAQRLRLFEVIRRIVTERALNNLLVVVQSACVLVRIRHVIQWLKQIAKVMRRYQLRDRLPALFLRPATPAHMPVF